MKKIQKLLVVSLAILLMNIANALEIIDVTNEHWASQEIVKAIQNGYINVIDNNKFKPENNMSRSEFVASLLKVIQRQDEQVSNRTSFRDLSEKTKNIRSVLLSEQIRMAFGYPDKTFKPDQAIDHNETMSMIANITKGDIVAGDITNFKDSNSIPLWAKRAYIKNVAHGLYVNHPDELTFNPKNELTRAEAAVLFDKISANLDLFKDKYRDLYNDEDLDDEIDTGIYFDKAQFLGENNLNLVPFAKNDKVQLYDSKKIIQAGNILIGTCLKQVESRKDLVGHEYVFTAPNDVYTVQGTFLYPKGTEFYARVNKIGYSAWRSKPEKSVIVFHKYSLPNGEVYDMAGVPFTKDDKVIYVKNIKNPKKAKKLTNSKKTQKEYMISWAHQMEPNIDFKIKNGSTIYILLTGDMVIPQDDSYLQLRTEKSLLEQERI